MKVKVEVKTLKF